MNYLRADSTNVSGATIDSANPNNLPTINAFLTDLSITPDVMTAATFDANDRELTETVDSTNNADDRYTVFNYGSSDEKTVSVR